MYKIFLTAGEALAHAKIRPGLYSELVSVNERKQINGMQYYKFILLLLSKLVASIKFRAGRFVRQLKVPIQQLNLSL